MRSHLTPLQAACTDMRSFSSSPPSASVNTTAGVHRLVRIVLEALWSKFVGPVLLWPLLSHRGALPVWAAGSGKAAPAPAPAQPSSTQLPSGAVPRAYVWSQVCDTKRAAFCTS